MTTSSLVPPSRQLRPRSPRPSLIVSDHAQPPPRVGLTHASSPVGNPQYPMTCIIDSLISASVKPLRSPPLTWVLSCEILPVAPRILVGVSLSLTILRSRYWSRGLSDSPNNDETPVLLLNPVAAPYPIPYIPDHVLHHRSIEVVHTVYNPLMGVFPKHFVHLRSSVTQELT